MLKRYIIIVLVALMPFLCIAQDMITKEQFKEIKQSAGIMSRDKMKQVFLGLCNSYKVKEKEKKVETYMSEQFDKDLFECYYDIASKYLTVDDYKYLIEKKNDPVAISATEHQARLTKMISDSLSVFTTLFENVISDGQSTVVEYECPESYQAKWKEIYGGNSNLFKSLYESVSQIQKGKGFNMDEDEYMGIYIPCVQAMICNWSYKFLTEKDLDYFIKEKDSPTQQHFSQYKKAMLMSKDDNIGTAVIKKAMEYFMIK